MASVRLVVTTALRKLGVVAAGREARPSDAADTLAALQGMYASWIASGAFGRLRDVVPSGSNYTAQGGERIYRRDSDTLEITLPELVSEVWNNNYGHERTGYYGTLVTIDTVGNTTTVTVEPSQPIGCAVPPRDGAAVVISDRVSGNTRAWLYNGTIKQWQSPDDLTLDAEAPRSDDFMGLSACLAMEMADQFPDQVIAPGTAEQAGRYKTAMVTRFGMRREVDYAPEVYY